MTHPRSRSQLDDQECSRTLEQVDGRAKPSDEPARNRGIRHTRKGPWDPCRFQEYEVSPEFRKQVMRAKLPPADPGIFQDTAPPVQEAQTPVYASQLLEELQWGGWRSSPQHHGVKTLVILALLVMVGVGLGLMFG